MTVKIYTKQFKEMLPVLFKAQSHFINSFGALDVLDGVRNSDKAFTVKVSDIDVEVNDYDKGKDITAGRLGAMKEIISTDVEVDYEAVKSINEGVDMATVNDDIDQITAERMEKQAGAIARLIDESCGKQLSQKASKTLTGELTEDGVTKMFNQASKEFTQNEVIATHVKRAYVTSDIYNFLIDSKLATTSKNSSVNVDQNTLYSFKGFLLHEVPDARFTKGENAYFVADNIGKAFAGFNEYRALTDNLEFFGVAMQSIIKYGTYVPDNNSKAIVKGKLAITGA
ncbi:capsid protein [Melissococcus sp. OM08-11BH]|uniref:capsid protein n=1 Tax=Melissococcus sp. OM08-11BH TaxID=2293110 RepID=UPI000E4DC30A|nr:capsid protein [Melissococcus sp. OM08-11BH]RGI31872.1 capsid protein [Melissococcus sp. OM08-11BH]